jgi:hypothetical protein
MVYILYSFEIYTEREYVTGRPHLVSGVPWVPLGTSLFLL